MSDDTLGSRDAPVDNKMAIHSEMTDEELEEIEESELEEAEEEMVRDPDTEDQ